MVNIKKIEWTINKILLITKLRVPLTELVSYHVKQKLTRVQSACRATPVSVPITDL